MSAGATVRVADLAGPAGHGSSGLPRNPLLATTLRNTERIPAAAATSSPVQQVMGRQDYRATRSSRRHYATPNGYPRPRPHREDTPRSAAAVHTTPAQRILPAGRDGVRARRIHQQQRTPPDRRPPFTRRRRSAYSPPAVTVCGLGESINPSARSSRVRGRDGQSTPDNEGVRPRVHKAQIDRPAQAPGARGSAAATGKARPTTKGSGPAYIKPR